MEQTLLQVDGLTKQYGNFTLDHVSFSVPGGSIMGFVGGEWRREDDNAQADSR